jgi:hypothetical protein
MPANPHPYEIAFLVLSLIACGAAAIIFFLSIRDLQQTKDDGINGPVLYLAWDDIFSCAFTIATAVGLATLAWSGFNNPTPPSPQALNLVGGCAAFAFLLALRKAMIYRRRIVLARLIKQHDDQIKGRRGGKRRYDPPITEGATNGNG